MKKGFQILLNLFILLGFVSCKDDPVAKRDTSDINLFVLGVAQDAGYPHINYDLEWQAEEFGELERQLVVSLGLVDRISNQKYLFEATPDMPEQLYLLNKELPHSEQIVDGVFLTHAHMGHYTGLMHFGREAMGAKNIPVYAMPRMEEFIRKNGPWTQLVELNNIELHSLKADSALSLSTNLKVTPLLVPHRDEYSETVGFKIQGPEKSALFIPDINKWELWDRSIVEEVRKADYAFLDATFFKEGEIPRPMSEVPHPFITETVALFENEPERIRSRIIFIHFNHSNPALFDGSELTDSLKQLGYRFARRGDKFPL